MAPFCLKSQSIIVSSVSILGFVFSGVCTFIDLRHDFDQFLKALRVASSCRSSLQYTLNHICYISHIQKSEKEWHYMTRLNSVFDHNVFVAPSFVERCLPNWVSIFQSSIDVNSRHVNIIRTQIDLKITHYTSHTNHLTWSQDWWLTMSCSVTRSLTDGIKSCGIWTSPQSL